MAHPASQSAPKRVPTSTKVRLQVAGLEAQLQVKLREVKELQAQKAALVERLTQLQEALRQHPLPAGSTSAGPPCSNVKSSGLPVLVERQLAGALHALWQHTAQERQLAGQGRFSATAEQAAARNTILAQLRGCWCTILQAISAVLHQQQQQQQHQQQEDGPSSNTSQHQQLLVKLQQALQLILESLAQASPYCLWHFAALGHGATSLRSRSNTVMAQAPAEALSVLRQQHAAAAAAAEAWAAAPQQPQHVSAGAMPPGDSVQTSWQAPDAAEATKQSGGSSSSGSGLCHGSEHDRQPQLEVAVPAARPIVGTTTEARGGTGHAASDNFDWLLLPDLEQLLALEEEDMQELGLTTCADGASSPCRPIGRQQQYCGQEQAPWLTPPVVDYHPAAAAAAAAVAEAGASDAQWELHQQPPASPHSTAAGLALSQQRPAQHTSPYDLPLHITAALMTSCTSQVTLPPACSAAAGGVLGLWGAPMTPWGMVGGLAAPSAAAPLVAAEVLHNGRSIDHLAGGGNCCMLGPVRLSSSDLNNKSQRLDLPERLSLTAGIGNSTVPGMCCSQPVSGVRPNTASAMVPPLVGASLGSSALSSRSGSRSSPRLNLLTCGVGSGSSSNSIAHAQELPRPLFGAMLSDPGPQLQSGPWPACGTDTCRQPPGCPAGLPGVADLITAHFTCIGPAAAATAMAANTSAAHIVAGVAAGAAASSAATLGRSVHAVEELAMAAPPPATAAAGTCPAREPPPESSRWQVLLDRLQLRRHQVAKLLQLYGALGDAQRIHHLRLSELSHRLLDLSHASTQQLPGVAQANAAPSPGQRLLRMGDPALLEAADELQYLLLEGHQLMVELLLGVWGPQSPLTTDQCCRGLVAALPTLPDTGALMELLAQQQQQQQHMK